MDVIALKTATERLVTVTFDDGSVETFTFGQVQGKDGKWTLPSPEAVAFEVKAIIAARTGRTAAPVLDAPTKAAIEASL